ncbi:hypothetical protein JE592_003344 [Salmonella enterica]|nr:hypothetical protein [Salmonella enterica]
MNPLCDVLKSMQKATTREIAARLQIEPIAALGLLQELEASGIASSLNGLWQLSAVLPGAAQACPATRRAEPVVIVDDEPPEVTPEMVVEFLSEHGPADTTVISAHFNRNPRGMTSVLRSFGRQGCIVRDQPGRGGIWSVPDGVPAPQVVAVEQPAQAQPDTASVVESIPSFADRKSDLILPTGKGISREIRRTKARLESLLRLRTAMQQIRRNMHSLTEEMPE